MLPILMKKSGVTPKRSASSPTMPTPTTTGAMRGATKGDLDGALKDYTEAIRLKPDLAEAYNNRGVARAAKGDPDGALKDCTEAIRLKPDYAGAYNNRGKVRPPRATSMAP